MARGTLVTVGVLALLAAGGWALSIGPLANTGSAMQMEVSAPFFMIAWIVMVSAMMLPAVAPMVVTYQRITSVRGDGAVLPIVFVGGYLIVWAAAGLAPLAINLELPSLRMSIGTSAWSLLIAATFLMVGAYQLSPWKAACLRSCRAPLNFFMRHDFGSGVASAAKLGGLHGAVCLGCCWALMALMVVAGGMSLAWMAGLALLFLAEKAWRYGVALSRAAGAGAVGAAAVIALTGWSLG